MKLYVKELNGCLFCPNHTKYKYSSDLEMEGRCEAVIVRKGNYKLIRENEMYDENNGTNPYFKFPEWCPLVDK